MAAPHYVEILSGGPRPKWPEPPARLRTGSWKIWCKLNDSSGYGSARTLLWIKASGGGDGFLLAVVNDSGCRIRLAVDGVVVIDVEDVAFDALQRIKITVDAESGTLQVQGATSGNGTYSGTPWVVAEGGGEWRVGTSDAGANPARGYVSLPYGLQTDDPLPDDNDEPGYLLLEDSSHMDLEDDGGEVLLD